MSRKRYTEEQIAFAIRQHESGTAITEIVRKMGIAEQTFYRWKKKYAGMGVAEVRRLKSLDEEQEAQAAGGGPFARQEDAAGRRAGKGLRPARRRQVVERLQAAYQVSERRACRAIGAARSSHRCQSCRDERAELRIRLRDLAASRVRYGYRRLHVLLRREGWEVARCCYARQPRAAENSTAPSPIVRNARGSGAATLAAFWSAAEVPKFDRQTS